ncbi:CAP domain-containing protein [Bradyrhizobium sp. ARR65]|uniref:CAP domain-containing protein n=1 Tax=Bradyrhizobium sp. ARR65 TaxID=1040989 RepID=UPI00054FE0C5|nr:CAP domain-containing protein [Bradyrhizobium sp. ARR65]
MAAQFARALIAASVLTLSAHSTSAAEPSPAEQISNFRLKHGEVSVTTDATLNRIALEQAKAMAAKDQLSHEVLGSFSSRIAPSRAGRAAENIAYGYPTFDKTLEQWINSSEHRKNLLLHNASRVGIASAKDASGKRIYWAMEIAGDYEPKQPKLPKGKIKKERPVVAHATAPAAECHVKLLGLCI